MWWCTHCYWTLGLLFSPAWVSHFPLNVSSITIDPLCSSNILWTKFMSNSSIDHSLPWVKAHFSDELHSNARTLNLNQFHKMCTVPLQNNSVFPEAFGRVWWFYSHRRIQKIENWGFQWEVRGAADHFVIEGFFLWSSAFVHGRSASGFVDLSLRWCSSCRGGGLVSRGDVACCWWGCLLRVVFYQCCWHPWQFLHKGHTEDCH